MIINLKQVEEARRELISKHERETAKVRATLERQKKISSSRCEGDGEK